ncbi:MAG: bifunctional (p)ppGpp synthetase/guanosine-3',5'-bis(diphosphate) 3'-pyrophosphohydrolase [Candidatus Moraniibacteriota bacterium]|nr:MAG: bifunctional (p)ppGpp synthetase/guanosine-3',5'-bis(diphosphate) 3'-pyrophosphohydrolase [Candidatus Moranbacteria bacterium]
MAISLEDVFRASKFPPSNEGRRFVTNAYELASEAHRGQKRKSGEDYIEHSLGVAKILAEIGMESRTIAAGLLHDVPEDTAVSLDDIRKKFGNEVATLVDGVTKLGKIRLRGSREEYYLENLRKMFLAMAEDIRVVIVKLADRLHNMRTLDSLPPDKQLRIARETMEIFAPIANRLGIGEVKGELEDLAFKYLDPEAHEKTKDIVKEYMRESDSYLDRAVTAIRDNLAKEGVRILHIEGRAKRLYRLYQKLKRHDMDIKRVYDLVAIRIIVPNVADCYEAFGATHKRYRPMVGRIKDYISLPKPNNYQSLHTTVFGPEGRIIEIQIRTRKMHDEAELGIAAHWAYAERERSAGWRKLFFRQKETTPPKELAWVKQLQEWQREVGHDNREFLEGIKIDFFKNHIFAFTPKGDIIELPEEATPVDFAYAIHSEIGNTIVGAKADAKIVPLDYHIKNGEVIEIRTDKDRKLPNRDWLRFVKTSIAKSHIQKQLRREGWL